MEYRLIEDGDGLTLVRGGYAGDAISDEAVEVLATNFSGSFLLPTGNRNAYATQVGATFEIDFHGTELVFRHYTDSRGGVWRVTVDALSPVDVSTYSVSPLSNVETTIISGLSDVAHTAVFEFIGDDPLNPPTSTARGWFNYLATPSSSLDYAGTTRSGASIEVAYVDEAGALEMCAANSVLEFALSSKPAALPVSSSWVPTHGNASAVRDISTSVWLDGDLLPSGLADIPAKSSAFSRLVIQQAYDAYNTNDTSDTLMWSGVITHTFTGPELVVSHKLSYAVDVLQTGYLVMLPTNMTAADTLRVNGETYAVSTPTTSETTGMADAGLSACWLDSDGDSAFAATTSSFREAFLPETQELSVNAMFFTERTDDVAKVYWQARESATTPAGTVQTVVNRYMLASGIANIAGVC